MKNNTITELDGILSNIIIPKQSVVVFWYRKIYKTTSDEICACWAAVTHLGRRPFVQF
jgi:hypothetical protein